MGRRASLRTVPAIACGAGLVVALAGPVTAQADPPGNNGTVKIDGWEFDTHPDNQPHVGCSFQVDFYGFDEGDLDASVTFEAVAPTLGGELLTDEIGIGEDAAGGGTDLDGEGTYDLTEALAAIEPHPVQGWHVRLTVHAEGSQGADTKFKEFWVSGCETTTPDDPDEPGEPNVPGNPDQPGEPNEPADPEDPTPSSSVPIVPGDSDGPGPDTEIVPGAGTTPDDPSASTSVPVERTSGSGDLPNTGSNSMTLATAALALIAVGAGVVIVARRAHFGREN